MCFCFHGRRGDLAAWESDASRSNLVIGQALVHLQGRHRPTRPGDDPGWHACDSGPRWHVMQDNTARADLGVAADLDITEHLCSSAQQHPIAHFRVPVATLLPVPPSVTSCRIET